METKENFQDRRQRLKDWLEDMFSEIVIHLIRILD